MSIFIVKYRAQLTLKVEFNITQPFRYYCTRCGSLARPITTPRPPLPCRRQEFHLLLVLRRQLSRLYRVLPALYVFVSLRA